MLIQKEQVHFKLFGKFTQTMQLQPILLAFALSLDLEMLEYYDCGVEKSGKEVMNDAVVPLLSNQVC